MFIEMKTYRTYPGRAPAFAKLYEEKGLPVQVAIQGGLVGMYVTEFGQVNDVILLWRHESLAARRKNRAALAASQEWLDFMAEAAPMVLHEENRMMTPCEGAADFLA